MNCPNCGKEVKADMASCPSCGAPISAAPAVAAEPPRKRGIVMTPAKIVTLVVGSVLVAYILITSVLIPYISPTAPSFMGFYECDALSMEFTGSQVTITLKDSGAAPTYSYTYSDEAGLTVAKGKFVIDYDPAEDTITVAAGTLHRVY